MIVAAILTTLLTVPPVLLWVNALDKYYKSGQYEEDIKAGVYENNENFP